jgi:hypothetical protein
LRTAVTTRDDTRVTAISITSPAAASSIGEIVTRGMTTSRLGQKA